MRRLACLVLLAAASGCAVPTAPRPTPTPTTPEPDPYTRLMHRFLRGQPLPRPAFELANPGLPEPPDYPRYGTFKGVGTAGYEYEAADLDGLRDALGEGIYPNADGVFDDPAYLMLQRAGRLDVGHWDALGLPDLQAAFFIWTQAAEEPGVKTFFTAVTLEKAGLILPAIKAYHAVVVHFPRSACWAADQSFVWYVAPVALSSIRRLCAEYPSLGLWLEGGSVDIVNGQDTDLDNDVVSVDPGRFVQRDIETRLRALPDLAALPVAEQRGRGRVQAVKFSNGQWQLRVDGKPFVVRGVSYGPTEIGFSPNNDPMFGHRWMFTDKNGNGRADAPYDAWADLNGNGEQDAGEPPVGDLQLLKDMGCNAIRWYIPNAADGVSYDPKQVNKDLLRDMHRRFGIFLIAGDFLGAYTAGSGASWEQGTDYTDPDQRARMKEVVRQKVLDLRGEPFLLMWLLGNENNMAGGYKGVNATRTNAGSHPEAWAQFLNEVAAMIHELDPDHPVAIGNLGIGLAEHYRQHAPAIDIFGMNHYMGPNGFGNTWQEARAKFDRPVMVTEYGADAYSEGKGPDEEAQAAYHAGCLRDIVLNQAGGDLAGNSIGGIVFEYVDEWWKANDDPKTQTTHAQHNAPFGDGQAHEEWFGIVGQGSGRNSPFERVLRKAYFMYQDAWGGTE